MLTFQEKLGRGENPSVRNRVNGTGEILVLKKYFAGFLWGESLRYAGETLFSPLFQLNAGANP